MSLCDALVLPDDRWREHDPQDIPDAEIVAWRNIADSTAGAGVLWLGIESFGDRVVVDPVGYERLDETDFPHGVVWHSDPIPSQDLTAFDSYARDPQHYDAYSYVASLAWLAMSVRTRISTRPVLAGFGGGDYFVFGVL